MESVINIVPTKLISKDWMNKYKINCNDKKKYIYIENYLLFSFKFRNTYFTFCIFCIQYMLYIQF